VRPVELTIAVVLALFGVRSLRVWLGRRFVAESPGEQVAYSLFVTGRVGTWFALAGFFVGYAVVDEPQGIVRWYAFVPLVLAAIQLLAGFYLSRSPSPPAGPGPEG
jgi:hypothetical protein